MESEQFELFFNQVRPALVAYARLRLDADAAQDVALQTLQTIWMKDLKAPRSDAERRQLVRLAYKVLDGQISNHRRSHVRYLRLIDAVGQEAAATKRHAPDPADLVHATELEADVSALVGSLSTADQQVISLLIEGYKVAEIAALLCVRPGAVSMRLRRAKQNLTRLLERRQANAEEGEAVG